MDCIARTFACPHIPGDRFKELLKKKKSFNNRNRAALNKTQTTEPGVTTGGGVSRG